MTVFPISYSQTVLISSTVQASDSDVVVRSSDGQDFSLHKENLGLLTEGFPSAETPTAGEVVPLSESSTTLRLLFQFVYSQRYPSLEKLDLETTLELAEAAEKYVVHAAIYACKFRLRYRFFPISPFEIYTNYPYFTVNLWTPNRGNSYNLPLNTTIIP